MGTSFPSNPSLLCRKRAGPLIGKDRFLAVKCKFQKFTDKKFQNKGCFLFSLDSVDVFIHKNLRIGSLICVFVDNLAFSFIIHKLANFEVFHLQIAAKGTFFYQIL